MPLLCEISITNIIFFSIDTSFPIGRFGYGYINFTPMNICNYRLVREQ
ncbi:Uncharacterised protein [Klebsiella oxytoca]|uniref:Uncharacterized protein n=1 Tax=Klebsiella oxytoca TaxID=571 RepID=A0A6N2YBS2_KLEOX|nr:hypothetical protein HMPREF9689_00167 [Klebsiella oxytoca 10-5245]EYT05224.1 hypothetical protein T655_03460 [Klebsiella oxytoca G54]KLY32997.1 hypothetical protein SK92_02504 [Klebsiella oxytoca]KMV79873.1 hypothetical protein HMPREF9685_05041 [Klebsiella oxytoca 09-7231]KMV83711.1 hypothetical protein HMPREF9692_04071 [Klebsiella oxytoca 10-5248]KMV94949.1 hypothetical protein HMPREF9693_04138 [Klebsiella oxytoca 10-5249]KMV97608.1 hypothetical protein HMPREF9688_01112 [Klebsiella oxytoc